MEHKLEYPTLIKFLLGGKADFILHNLKSNNSINFYIEKKEKYWAVYYKIHDVENYIGCILHFKGFKNENKYVYRHSNKLDTEQEYKMANIFHSLFKFIFIDEFIPKDCEILYTGKCSVCNRKLTDPESVKIGIGKDCLSKM